jgi:hypothetical protein
MKRLPPVLSVGIVLLSASTWLTARARADDVPSLVGTWTWSWKDPQGETHRHVLEVEAAGEKLAARERFDDLPPARVEKLTLDNKKVRFSVVRGEHRADYSGTLDGSDIINGTVIVTDAGQSHEFVWKAEKKPSPKPDRPPRNLPGAARGASLTPTAVGPGRSEAV